MSYYDKLIRTANYPTSGKIDSATERSNGSIVIPLNKNSQSQTGSDYDEQEIRVSSDSEDSASPRALTPDQITAIVESHKGDAYAALSALSGTYKERAISPLSDTVAKLIDQIERAGSDGELSDKELEAMSGAFKRLAMYPKKGSLIDLVAGPGMSAAVVDEIITRSWFKNFASAALFSPANTDLLAYTVYSLVLPHKQALQVADAIGNLVVETGTDSFSVLSVMTGHKISNKTDLLDLIRVALRPHSSLLELLLSLT